MSNPKHDKGEHYLTTPKAEPFLERLIFNNRPIILVVFAVLTLFLGYNAVKIQPDASFERMIPLEHPYIVNMLDHRDDLKTSVTSFVSPSRSKRAIFSPRSTWKL